MTARDVAGLRLGDIQDMLASLTAQAGAAKRPRPTVINPPGHFMPGWEWQVNHPCEVGPRDRYRQWAVRTIDRDDVEGCVYVHTPGHMPDDYVAATSTEIRQYALALLAACDRADGISHLDDRRKP